MQQDDMNSEIQKLRNQVKELKLTLVHDAKDWETEKAQLMDQLQATVGYA